MRTCSTRRCGFTSRPAARAGRVHRHRRAPQLRRPCRLRRPDHRGAGPAGLRIVLSRSGPAPAAGRLPGPEADAPIGAHPIAVLSHEFWHVELAGGRAFREGAGGDKPGSGATRPGQAPDPGASNTAVTSTANPASSREVAVSPGANTPCSTYRFSSSASTVIVSLRGSTIQYSGMPASA